MEDFFTVSHHLPHNLCDAHGLVGKELLLHSTDRNKQVRESQEKTVDIWPHYRLPALKVDSRSTLSTVKKVSPLMAYTSATMLAVASCRCS